jgi:hypothetical protein
MGQLTQHITRKLRQLRVPVLPAEEQEIKRLASMHGLPVAAYLREVGLNHSPRGIVDNKRVEELAAMHGELGRLGHLLKRWLEDDVRTAAVDAPTLRAALEKIARTQDEMHEIMRGVVLPVTAAGGGKFSR